MKKRLLAALLACILCFALLPQVALADGTININNPTSSPPGTGWSVSGSVVTITDGGTYTISGTTTTTTNRIVVAQNVKTTITLKDVNIDVSGSSNTAALLLQDGADVTLRLEGTSVLKSGGNYAGIQAPEGTTLTIEGGGTLRAYGGDNGAGIGGGVDGDGGEITIAESANVTATGGLNGAGIGGGASGNGGTITIEGSGTLEAYGGELGAGIGGGYSGDGGEIKITGRANVTAQGGYGAAGIGGGGFAGDGGEITIAGSAKVNATGGGNYGGGAGIGGGGDGDGGEITIAESANVTATGGLYGWGSGDEYGTGIGNGYGGKGGGTITIEASATVKVIHGLGSDPDLSGYLSYFWRTSENDGFTANPPTAYVWDAAHTYVEITPEDEPPTPQRTEPLPQRMVPTYTVEVTCLGPGASNIKAPREVDAGSILRVKLYPEEGAALLALTVNGQTYDPSLLKVEGEALIYGINRIDEDYELVAEFGEPFVVDVPEVEVTDPPKTGDAAASGGFAMLLALAVGVALWRARRSRAKN